MVQKPFQWEFRDPNWIPEDYQSAMTVLRLDRLRIYEHRSIRKTYGQWQIAASKEQRGPRSKRADRGPWSPCRRQNWQLGSLDRETGAISDARLALSDNPASLGKTPREGKAPSTRSHGKLGNHGESTKANDGTRAPKPAVYWGHPWAISGFG